MMGRGLRLGLVIFIVMATGACAAHKRMDLPVQQYHSEMKGEEFVPVNVELAHFQNGEYCSPCSIVNSGHVVEIFRRSLLFRDVTTNAPYTPYHIRLVFNRNWDDDKVSLLTKGIIAGGSLGLIPVKINQTFYLVAEVRQEHETLQAYGYSLENDNLVSLFGVQDAKKIEEHSLEMLLNDFFTDLIQDKVLPRSTVEVAIEKEEKVSI